MPDIASHHLDTEPRCRTCGYRLDGATNANPGKSEPPKDGDFSLCWYCGEWGVFEGGLIRIPTEAEWRKIEVDPRLVLVEMQWCRMVSKRPRHHFR